MANSSRRRAYGGADSAGPTGAAGLAGDERAHKLTFYQEPPGAAVQLEDFEGLAVERLRVMSAWENAISRGEKGEAGRQRLNRLLAESENMGRRNAAEAQRDNISHWVMRLAFCKTEDLRRRVLAFEVALFRHRFDELKGSPEAERFTATRGARPISDGERDKYLNELRAVMLGSAAFKVRMQQSLGLDPERAFMGTRFYKVRFTEVPELISKRRVFVRAGDAFVPQGEFVAVLASRFRAHLSQKLAHASKSLPIIEADERMPPLLGKLQNAHTGPSYDSTAAHLLGGKVTPDMIGALAPRSFPMCMRQVHSALTQEHHLKHWGRLQFQLFLKGVGVTLDDCIAYMQSEFIKGPTGNADAFQKKYVYNIRHAYGQEGKRTDYTPHSCAKVINGSTPGASEHHGCPYKTYTADRMRVVLQRSNGAGGSGTMSAGDINQICDLMSQGHFQVACRRHWEATHPGGDSENVGNHPNAWYEESVKYFRDKPGAAGGDGGSGDAAALSSASSPIGSSTSSSDDAPPQNSAVETS